MTETADTSALRGELEQRAEPREARSIRDLLEGMKPELVKSLRRDDAAEMLIRHYYTALRFNPKLLECSADSLVGALLLSAQLGLEPGPLGHVYLVPHKEECTWILGYTGIVELARRSGRAGALEALLVWDNDAYEYRRDERGAHFTLVPGDPEERSERRLVVTTWKEKVGGTWMPRVHQTLPPRIYRAKGASMAYKAHVGPWVTDEDKMWLRTGVRDCRTELPMTPELAQAFYADDSPVHGVTVDDLGTAQPALDLAATTDDANGGNDDEATG